MIPAGLIEKATPDDLPYAFDFVDWAFVATDAIASGTVTVVGSPSDLAIGTVTVSGTQLRTEFSGGTDGSTYKLLVKATTASGKVIAEYYYVKVSQPY